MKTNRGAPSLCEGGGLKFFKIKGEEKEGERGVFEIFIGGKIAGDELQTENKISE